LKTDQLSKCHLDYNECMEVKTVLISFATSKFLIKTECIDNLYKIRNIMLLMVGSTFKIKVNVS
jgi:hypothetical protein